MALEIPEPLKMQRFHERTGQRIPNDCDNGELLPAEEIRLPDNITCDGNIEEKVGGTACLEASPTGLLATTEVSY